MGFSMATDFHTDLATLKCGWLFAALPLASPLKHLEVEKAVSEQIDFFHLNSLSSSIVVKVDLDLTLTVAARNLYRTMALMLKGHEWETPRSLNAKFF